MWNGKQAKIMLKISGEAFPFIAPGSCLNCIAIFIHYSAFWFWFCQLTTVSFQKTVTWRCSRRSFDSKTSRLSRKLSKDVPVIESFFMLALIHQLEKEWEESTRLQSSGREEKVWILIQDSRENLQHLESESTPMSNCRSPSEGDVVSKQVVYLTQEDLFQRY